MTGPLPLSHPESVTLLVDVERERVTYTRSGPGRSAQRGAYLYHHDDGRDITSVVNAFLRAGLVRRSSGYVEATAAGVLHIHEHATRAVAAHLAGLSWGGIGLPVAPLVNSVVVDREGTRRLPHDYESVGPNASDGFCLRCGRSAYDELLHSGSPGFPWGGVWTASVS